MSRVVMIVAIALTLSACGSSSSTPDSGTSRAKTVAGLTGAAAKGKTLYETNGCQGCHGPTGAGTPAGKNLVSSFKDDSLEELAGYVINGIPPSMPAYGADLSDQDIADILAHGKATFK
jgi:mono/diheme cytochrome c family protein